MSRGDGPEPKRRRSGVVTSPAGWGTSDHICWAYDAPSSWRSAAAGFLARGIDAGEALLYSADRPAAGLLADLAGLPGRDLLLDTGRLDLMPTAELYGYPATFDPARQVAAYRALARAAAGAGYAGLRVAADATSLVPDRAAARRFARYELAVDALIAAGGMSVMCGYDQARLGSTLRSLACVHPLRHARPTPGGYAFFAEGGGWRVVGEVDGAVETDFRAALGVACAGRAAEVDLMLDTLGFIDVAGARVLAEAAERLGEGRRLGLHGLAHGPRTVLRLTGWHEATNLVVEEA